ncbi:hypothetical protein ACVWWG_001646 [Bradyrhizobium sp. LB7.2]
MIEAICNTARASILPIASINMPPPSADGIHSQRLRDGRELRLSLSCQYLERRQREFCTVLVYALHGNAVVDKLTAIV